MRVATLIVVAVVAAACGGGGSSSSSSGSTGDNSSPSSPTGSTSPQGLEGTWKATSATFVSVASSSKRTDVVAQGAVVTLALTGSTFALTFTYPEKAPAVTNGTWTSSKDMMSLKPTGMSWSWHFDMNQSGNTLSLSGASVEFDFSGTGVAEQARLSMTLVRQ
jgi:hypothetical protein